MLLLFVAVYTNFFMKNNISLLLISTRGHLFETKNHEEIVFGGYYFHSCKKIIIIIKNTDWPA